MIAHPDPKAAALKVLYDRAVAGQYSDASLTVPKIKQQSGLVVAPAVFQVFLDELVDEGLVKKPPHGIADRFQITADGIRKLDKSASIDSSSWTGLPRGFRLDEGRREAIVRQLDRAEQALSATQASQHNQAQARAYILAARALLEAPEPDPQIAWTLIQRANALSGIASLFVAIVALFRSI